MATRSLVSCSVCTNTSEKCKDLMFYHYPKLTLRRQSWLEAVGREDLFSEMMDPKLRKNYFICGDHFEKYFQRVPFVLADNAFPTLNLPKINERNENLLKAKDAATTFIEIEDSDESFTDQEPLTDQEITLTCNVTGRVDMSELEPKKIPQKCKELYVFKDKETKDAFLDQCENVLGTEMSEIIKWKINSTNEPANGNKHSVAFQLFALNIHYLGPTTNRFFTKTFNLPPFSVLKKLVKPTGSKMNELCKTAFKIKVGKMEAKEKICSVCVGYMPVKRKLYYDTIRDQIKGLYEINGVQKPELAQNVIVVMVRGLITNWQQPIEYAFIPNYLDPQVIDSWIENLIIFLLEVGLDVRAFVTDLDFVFQSRFLNNDQTSFEVNGHKIFFIFDVPFLMKRVRDNLQLGNFTLDGRVAKWLHIEELYELDLARSNNLAPKLTKCHIYPNESQKQSVILAIQVLSNTVASALNAYVDLHLIDESARDTAFFISKFNNLFDLLNSSPMKSSNIFQRAFRGDKYQIEYLNEMLLFLKHINFVNKTETPSFIRGFEITIRSILQLQKDLSYEGRKFIFTRRLNKECVEKLFFEIKRINGYRKNTCHKVGLAFNRVFVLKLLKPPEGLTKIPKTCPGIEEFLTEYRETKPVPEITAVKIGTEDHRLELPKTNRLIYLTGFLLKKCIDVHKCPKIHTFINICEQAIRNSAYNQRYKDSVDDFSIIPPENIITYVKLLEQKFCDFFVIAINHINVANGMLSFLQNFTFYMPCECFPLHYFQKLFVRFRIYHIIKTNNQLLRSRSEVLVITSLE